ILTKDKPESFGLPSFYPHNAMRDNTLSRAEKDDIPHLNMSRLHGLHRDGLVFPDGGIHASARGPEPDTLPST
ncbi:MAG: hypothetical protein PVH02_12415, partial [Desulfobacteraceae bacterium]